MLSGIWIGLGVMTQGLNLEGSLDPVDPNLGTNCTGINILPSFSS